MKSEHVKACIDAVEMCCQFFGIETHGIVLVIDQAEDGVDVGVDLPNNAMAPALLRNVADAYQRGIDEGKV